MALLLMCVPGVTFCYFGSLVLTSLPLELEEVFLNKNLLNSSKNNVIRIWGSWIGKSGRCLAWEPKFKSQVPHSIRKELTPSHYPQTSTQALCCECALPPPPHRVNTFYKQQQPGATNWKSKLKSWDRNMKRSRPTGDLIRPCIQTENGKEAWESSSVAACLPIMPSILGSISNTEIEKKRPSLKIYCFLVFLIS